MASVPIVTAKHPRNTTRHREAAAASRVETRRRLLVAAGEEFTERGYSAATVKRIAERAGVTVQTLYLAWTSKATLLRAHLEDALAGHADVEYADAIGDVVAQTVEDAVSDPVAAVEAFAHLFRTIAERAAPAWQLYRDAAAADPEIAADWHALQRLRRRTFARFVDQLPAAALRRGLTPDAALDTAWTIASPESHELFVTIGGHSLDDYEAWLAATLTAALLADGHHHTN